MKAFFIRAVYCNAKLRLIEFSAVRRKTAPQRLVNYTHCIHLVLLNFRWNNSKTQLRQFIRNLYRNLVQKFNTKRRINARKCKKIANSTTPQRCKQTTTTPQQLRAVLARWSIFFLLLNITFCINLLLYLFQNKLSHFFSAIISYRCWFSLLQLPVLTYLLTTT